VHFLIISPLSFRAENNPDQASIQDERVYVLKLELVETTSLLKKEEMNPRLGGSTENIIEDIYFHN
jgi:hypothetical protein